MRFRLKRLQTVLTSFGLFVAKYKRKYVYVNANRLWNPKNLAVDPDFNTFKNIADRVTEDDRTLLGDDRLYVLWQAVRNTSFLRGSVAEIGSYRGGSAFFIADSFRTITGKEVEFHVIDTFEGHPDCITPGIDREDKHKPKMFGDTDYNEVVSYLSCFGRTQIHKGEITDIIETLAEQKYRMIHIDVDLYQPTLDCLEYFGPRMVRGGIIVLDDYGSKKCPGVQKVLKIFLKRSSRYSQWLIQTEQAVLVRI